MHDLRGACTIADPENVEGRAQERLRPAVQCGHGEGFRRLWPRASPRPTSGLCVWSGLTLWPRTAVSARGMEVWVLDLSQADRARQFLKEHRAALAARADD